MKSMNGWYVAGLILVVLLALYAPRYAGALVILVALVLGVRAAEKKLV